MNCEEFRFAVGAEPNTTRVEVLEHAASCPECARYRSEVRAMDDVIHKALAIDTEVRPAAPRSTAPAAAVWRIAASLAAAAVLASIIWIAYPRDSFAEEIVAHVIHEPASWSATEVDRTFLERVMAEAGVRLKPDALDVTYAMTCPFRGRETPHLVVGTVRGPVTVLVMPHEAGVTRTEPFEEQGFVGAIVPAPRGAIAVLGKDVDVDAVSRQVLTALDYGW
jgi:hypothetical protein